jgi:hypothetical protein
MGYSFRDRTVAGQERGDPGQGAVVLVAQSGHRLVGVQSGPVVPLPGTAVAAGPSPAGVPAAW